MEAKMTTAFNKRGKMTDQELKAKWIEALRSGEYAQGVGNLCEIKYEEGENGKIETREYCCLGVLLEVMGTATTVLENMPGTGERGRLPLRQRLRYQLHREDQDQMDTSSTGLPVRTRVRLGLTEADEIRLVTMNDGDQDQNGGAGMPQSFRAIADWIQENL